MKTNIKDISGSKKEIHFEVPASEFSKYIRKEDDMQQASQKLIQDKYLEFVREEGLTPVSPPRVQIVQMAPGNDAEFKVTVTVMPEIDLPDLEQKLKEVEAPKTEVSEKEVDENLQALQKSRAEFKDLDRPAAEGDFVHVKFSSSLDKEEREDRFILGEGQLIPGFEEELKGMKAGEDKNFTLSYPEEYYQEDRAGKEARFEVKMVQVQDMNLPPLNDEFAQEVGDFEDLKQLRQQVQINLEQNKEKQNQQQLQQKILNKIKEDLEVELPESVVEAEKQRLLKVLKQNVKDQLDLSFDQYLDRIDKTEEELKDSFTDQAQQNALDYLILQKVGQEEEIEVTDEAVKQQTKQFLENIPEERAEQLEEEQAQDYVRHALYNQKVFARLKSYIQS